jgi:DNA-binding beta-propeller fold protein YncE
MTDPDPRGALWAVHYTPSSVDQAPYALELVGLSADADFHPVGIEVTPTQSDDEIPRLLVINQGRHRPTIEVFRIQLGETIKLTHEMTLQHPSFIAPNAMVAISSMAFYLSQDHYFTYRIPQPFNKVLPFLESMLALPLGRVSLVLFDTQGVRKVQTIARGIPFANGVALSPDGSALAVASTNRAEVWFYSKNETSITFINAVKVPFSPDNIAYAGDRLLVAGHPYLPAFMALKEGKTTTSPSYVSAIVPPLETDGHGLGKDSWISRISGGSEVIDVFKSDGSFFTSSSGAFADVEMQTMFVVGLYDGNGVAKCRFVV